MKTFRVVTAAFMVFLGAMLVVMWAIAGRAVDAIDSGEAATNITEKLLAEPALADGVATRIQTELEERVADTPLRFLAGAFSNEIHDALVAVITSDAVTNIVTTSVGRVEERITQEVTDPDRPPGPFVVTIDPSERINARIDQIPVVGFLIPSVEVEPVSVELIDAQTFEDVRTVYQLLDAVATWAIWVALALIVGGFWVAPKSRWYWAQALLGAGFVVLAMGFAINRLVPQSLANAVPGGASGGAGKFLSEFVSEHSIAPMTRVLFGLALIALGLAVVFALIARFLPQNRRARAEAAAAGAELDSAERDAAEAAALSGAAPQAAWAVAAAGGGAPAVVADPIVVVDPVAVDEPASGEAEPALVEPTVVEPPLGEPVAAATEAPATTVPLPSAEAPKATRKAPAAKPRAAKAAPAKAAPAKAAPAKAAPAKAAPAKAAPAKAAPAKAAPAKAAAKKPTARPSSRSRAQKPTQPPTEPPTQGE